MPHIGPELVAWAAERGIPTLPGAATPTEVLAAWRAGAAAVKLFPASALGPSFIRELRRAVPGHPGRPDRWRDRRDRRVLHRRRCRSPSGLGSWLVGDGAPAGVTDRARQVVAAVAAARRGSPGMTVEVVTLGECLISLIATQPGPLAEAGHVRAPRRRSRGERRGRARPARPLGRVHRAGRRRRLRHRDRPRPAWRGRRCQPPRGRRRRDHGPDAARAARPRARPQVVYARTGSAGSRITPEDVRSRGGRRRLRDARWLHLTGITPALSAHGAPPP